MNRLGLKSLRWRLILPTSVATAIILAALGVSLYLSMRRSLTHDFNEAQRLGAMMLAEMTEQHDDRLVFEGEAPKMPEYSAEHPDPQYFQIIVGNGDTLTRSASLGTGSLPASNSPGTFGEYLLPNGRRGQLYTMHFTPKFEHDLDRHEEKERIARGSPMPVHAHVPGPVTLLMAKPVGKLEASLATLRLRLVGLTSIAVLASAVLMVVLIEAGLRPVSALAEHISAVDANDLSARIALERAPSELSPVVARLNELLDRLQGAFERERAFSADVAHELRTPLAGIQTTLEVSLSQARDPRVYRETMEQCLAATQRLTVMVENLLTMARVDSDQLRLRAGRVEVAEALMDAWLGVAERAGERNLEVEWRLGDELAAQCDGDRLGLILRNLFDNAVSYANDGGWIRVTSRAAEDAVEISVRNSGSPITAADVEHLFERFWRHDRSRKNEEGHHGLGLPLCKRIAAALGGELEASAPAAGEFEITLRLPMSNAERDAVIGAGI